jgi:membrane protein
MSVLADARAAATERWRVAKQRHAWLAHLARAWQRFQENNGSQYAAAITYFSFLALFPLILLAVSVVGFVLHSHPNLQTELFADITKKVPGDFGTTLQKSINSAVRARTGVGIVGLAGVLLTGLGWVGNVRQAVDAVWGVVAPKRNFVTAKFANLLVLAGLGIGIVFSLGLATVGTAVTDQIVNGVGLGHVIGITVLFTGLSIVLGVAGDMIIFGWVLVRLPGGQVPRAVALRGALLAAVGFEVLKIVGTYTIAKSAHNPTLGPFAGLLAVLIWIELVSRFVLFCAAWTATGAPVPEPAEQVVELEPVEGGHNEPGGPSPLGVAATLLGLGAAVGAGAAIEAQRRIRNRT